MMKQPLNIRFIYSEVPNLLLPYKDPKKKAEHNRMYRKNNEKYIRKKGKEYRDKNKEKIATYKKKWMNDNKDKWSAYWRGYRQRLKIEVFSHYCKGKLKCECCKENYIEFLTLDHKNNDGNKHRRSLHIKGALKGKQGQNAGRRFYAWLKRNGYPQNLGLRILCWNCNCAQGFYSICPHIKRPKIRDNCKFITEETS